jgi:APA family basic amino acid/polyamine antiporter
MSVPHPPAPAAETAPGGGELKKALGLFSATTIVAGSMIGSGIFIVSADIARHVGTAGLLIAIWVFTGLVTLMGAYSYGKLAAHMPRAGGQYVFLRESWGDIPAFLYGWAMFSVIQTGTVAAVAVAFGKFLGVLVPAINSQVLIPLTPTFGISSQQLVAVALLLGLTAFNCTGVKNGAVLQNLFTVLKVIALVSLIVIGLVMGQHLWGGGSGAPLDWSLSAGLDVQGSLVVVFAAATVGGLFSADAWNNVTFIGGEVQNARRNLPKALVMGVGLVVGLYVLVNLAYLNVLPMDMIQHAPEDRVATAAMNAILGDSGAVVMALIILVSTFGCLNGMLLAGARVCYAMAKDKLLFARFATVCPKHHTPNFSLWVQGIWASLLALSGQYGQLLDFVIFTALLFYFLTIVGLFKLARTIPEEVQMRSWRDYMIPVLYLVGITYVAIVLLATPEKTMQCLYGIGLTLVGLPLFWVTRRKALSTNVEG